MSSLSTQSTVGTSPRLTQLMSGTMSPTIGAMVYELAAGLHTGASPSSRATASRPRVPATCSARPEFVEMLRHAKREFASLPNTADRVRLKAQMLTEMGLEEMWEIIRHPAVPAAARVSAYNASRA